MQSVKQIKYYMLDIKFPIKDFGLALNYLYDSYGHNVWIGINSIKRIIANDLICTLINTRHLKLGKNSYLFTK